MRGVTVRPKVKEWLVFAAFLVLAIGLRISSFFKTVIDPDETLYLLISREMLRGQVLYTGLWDHKPPGIFAVYAAIQTALGESIFAMRLAACIVVATTCYLLYRLGTFIGGGRERYGLLAGLLYVVYSLNMGGLAANTEIFFTPLVTLAFYLLFTAEQYPVRLVGPGSLRVFLIGLLLGLGLQINYVVLFAFVAVALIVGGALYAARKSMTALLKQAFATYALLGVGFVLPLPFIILYFSLAGHLDDYLYAAFWANILYTGTQRIPLLEIVTTRGEELMAFRLLWICLILTPLYLFYVKERSRTQTKHLVWLGVWVLMAGAGISITGRFFNHYFLQFLPPLSLISAAVILDLVRLTGEPDKPKRALILTLILLSPLLATVYQPLKLGGEFMYYRYVKGDKTWGDTSAQIADYLRDRVSSDDYIYIADYQFVVWYLLPAKIPTRFAFSPYILVEEDARMARVNPVEELDSIMSKKPLYVIRRPNNEKSAYYTALFKYLEADYEFEKWFPEVDEPATVRLYRRKAD